MADLVLLASGRASDVYVLAPDRVLRRYRNGGDVATEAAVMAHVAAHGYPVPAVYAADGQDLVMERLDGPTLLEAVASGEYGAAQVGWLLAQLHDLPARCSEDPGVRILHPANVLLTGRGPVVIDWTNTAEGPPELDVAVSALILGLVAVGGPDDPAHEYAGAASAILEAFLAATTTSPLRMLDHAVARRRGDRGLTSAEISRLDAAADLVQRLVAGSSSSQEGSPSP